MVFHGSGILKTLACTAAAGALLVGIAATDATAGVRVKQNLSPTVVNPSGKGQAAMVVSGRPTRRKGKFKVVVHKLAPLRTFSVKVAGVAIGTLTTNAGGNGKARFSTQPNPVEQPLGVDPRGEHVAVADDQGEDALEGDLPDDSPNPCCCHENSDGEQEGDEVDETSCHDMGGSESGAFSCIPDPCQGGGQESVCCSGDGDHAECELRTIAECAAHQGVSLPATSCEPNPCTPPPPPTVTRCCVPEDHGDGESGSSTECEELTPDHCAAEGGQDVGPGHCDGDPCGGGSPSGAFLDVIDTAL